MNPTPWFSNLNHFQGLRAPFTFLRRTSHSRQLVVHGNVSVHPYLIQQKCTGHSRTFHDRPSSSSSSTISERLRELKRNGTPELAFGSIILALVGIDYVLRGQNDQEREAMVKQLAREVRRDAAITRREDQDMVNKGLAAKFKCIVRKVPENFDGHKCLKNVKVGDVVNVIEEGIGPGGQYNLCFIAREATNNGGNVSHESLSIGWFPCCYLQKVE